MCRLASFLLLARAAGPQSFLPAMSASEVDSHAQAQRTFMLASRAQMAMTPDDQQSIILNSPVVYSFPDSANLPQSPLTLEPDGKYYGTTSGNIASSSQGGSPNTFYRFDPGAPPSQQVTALFSFPDGIGLRGAVVFDQHGNPIVNSQNGGDCGFGAVWQGSNENGAWRFNILKSFRGGGNAAGCADPTDGLNPDGTPTVMPNGDLIISLFGGYQGQNGGFVRLRKPSTPAGEWTATDPYILPAYGASGAAPVAGVTVIPSTGEILFTTYYGGLATPDGRGYGVVGVLQPPPGTDPAASIPLSQYTPIVVHTFADNGDGRYPASRLIVEPSGNVAYSLTYEGGPYEGGTVYKVWRSNKHAPWAFATVLTLGSKKGDGIRPLSDLTPDPNDPDSFYAATAFGGDSACSNLFGVSGCGTVSRITIDPADEEPLRPGRPPSRSSGTAALSTIYAFLGNPADGAIPYDTGPIAITPDGKTAYITTLLGGTGPNNNNGAIEKITLPRPSPP